MESKFAEIRTDFVDENGVIHLDGYKTEDDNEEGTGIGYFIKGEVYWRDPEFQFDPHVKEVVEELKLEHEQSSNELKEEINKPVEELEKALKKLVSEGYKLKKQHGNPEWKKALEDAETILISKKKKL